MDTRTLLPTTRIVVSLLVAALIMLVGCDNIGGIVTTTDGGSQTTESTEAPATTEAPETTEAPVTTEADDTAEEPDAEEEGLSTEQYILIGVLALLLIIIIVLLVKVFRRGKKPQVTPAAAPSWKVTAEDAYSQSRWLYDNLTPEIAQWRGDLLHGSGGEVTTPTPDTASAQEQTWSQLGTVMTGTITTLYSLETQLEPSAQPVVRAVIDSLNSTRTAVDDVSSARLAVLQATDGFQGDPGNQQLQQNLAAAHELENQSVEKLNGNRAVLNGALANLAAMR